MSELIYVQMPARWVTSPFKPKTVAPERIIEAVTGFYGVSFVRVLSKDRYRKVVRARHMIYYFLRTLTGETLVGIADRMNREGHTAVLRAIEKIQNFYPLYPDVRYEVDTIKFKLTA